MPEAVIVSAVRTPIGALGGALAAVRPDDLAALVIAEALKLAAVDPAAVEEVYFGCANQAGEDNRNVARMATLLAGLPVEAAAVTFNRLCASGLAAVNAAARAIKVGEGEVFVAGGVESMSRAPYAVPKAEQPFAFGNLTAWDTALGWRFPNPRMQELYGTESMGETAETMTASVMRTSEVARILPSPPAAPPPSGRGVWGEGIPLKEGIHRHPQVGPAQRSRRPAAHTEGVEGGHQPQGVQVLPGFEQAAAGARTREEFEAKAPQQKLRRRAVDQDRRPAEEPGVAP